MTERIAKLKAWQFKSIKELKFLLQKLKYAVPLAEFEKTSNQMQNYKNKCADLLERVNKMTKQNSDM